MARHSVSPQVRFEGDRTVMSHPAFGQISASRVQGTAYLYGSDFEHNSTIRIRIAGSELHRHLSTDWYHPGEGIVEIELSEAQWAHFVSSLNIYGGSPCTIREREGRIVDDIPAPSSRVDVFQKELVEKLDGSLRALSAARDAVVAAKMANAERRAALSKIDSAIQELKSDAPFVARLFGEHAEQTVEKAKIEVEAHIHQTIVRAGLSQIADGAVVRIASHDQE